MWGPGFPNVWDTQNFMTSDGHADRGIGNETKPHPRTSHFVNNYTVDKPKTGRINSVTQAAKDRNVSIRKVGVD